MIIGQDMPVRPDENARPEPPSRNLRAIEVEISEEIPERGVLERICPRCIRAPVGREVFCLDLYDSRIDAFDYLGKCVFQGGCFRERIDDRGTFGGPGLDAGLVSYAE